MFRFDPREDRIIENGYIIADPNAEQPSAIGGTYLQVLVKGLIIIVAVLLQKKD